MPRQSREAARARRRPVIPYRTSRGNYVNYGPQALDQVSGLPYPKRLMVPQRGGLVSEDWADGTRDAVDPIDHRMFEPSQLPVPDPLYRVLSATFRGALMLTEEERDTAVPLGFTWQVAGFAYPDGDEETGLVKLYRLLNPSNGNHLHTISAAEAAAAVVAGFTMETDSVFVSATAAPGRVAVSRYFNATTSTHYFTTDPLEIPRLTGTWGFEGVMFYIWRGPERTRSN